jgi:hypothetical protein
MTPAVHIDTQGRIWRPYVIEFKSQDSAAGLAEGTYPFIVYALSIEHAHLMLDDLRATAQVKGELVHRSTP